MDRHIGIGVALPIAKKGGGKEKEKEEGEDKTFDCCLSCKDGDFDTYSK